MENIAARREMTTRRCRRCFTHPEVASVGLTEAQQGAGPRGTVGPFLRRERPRGDLRRPDGFIKVVASKVGECSIPPRPQATDLIAEGARLTPWRRRWRTSRTPSTRIPRSPRHLGGRLAVEGRASTWPGVTAMTPPAAGSTLEMGSSTTTRPRLAGTSSRPQEPAPDSICCSSTSRDHSGAGGRDPFSQPEGLRTRHRLARRRGGTITYHGRGSVLYPILDLRPSPRVKATSRCRRRSTVPEAVRHERSTGEKLHRVWVGIEKIAAIGVGVSTGRHMHGVAVQAHRLSHFPTSTLRLHRSGVTTCSATTASGPLETRDALEAASAKCELDRHPGVPSACAFVLQGPRMKGEHCRDDCARRFTVSWSTSRARDRILSAACEGSSPRAHRTAEPRLCWRPAASPRIREAAKRAAPHRTRQELSCSSGPPARSPARTSARRRSVRPGIPPISGLYGDMVMRGPPAQPGAHLGRPGVRRGSGERGGEDQTSRAPEARHAERQGRRASREASVGEHLPGPAG